MPHPSRDRAQTLENAARESVWLYDSRHGVSPEEIARREDLTVNRVRFGLERAAAMEARLAERPAALDGSGPAGLRLIPLFPIGPFTPQSRCPHEGPLPTGSRLICMVCHSSGMDDHPGLQREPERGSEGRRQLADARIVDHFFSRPALPPARGKARD